MSLARGVVYFIKMWTLYNLPRSQSWSTLYIPQHCIFLMKQLKPKTFYNILYKKNSSLTWSKTFCGWQNICASFILSQGQELDIFLSDGNSHSWHYHSLQNSISHSTFCWISELNEPKTISVFKNPASTHFIYNLEQNLKETREM